ncbi:MAG TPA: DUF1573 domain-containing protein [Vicinamibacterales bacterium]
MRRLLALFVLVLAAGCGSGSNSPMTPTPTPTPTKIIGVTGSLNYGQVVVGDVRTDGSFTINNSGNATLTVSGITGPCGNFFTVSWVNGAIAAGASQVVNVRFAPTAVQNCSGVVTVNGDQTSGSNTIAVTANIVAGYAKDLTGSWRGTIGFDTIVTLTETSGNLSGTFNGIGLKGTVSGSVSNTGAVTLTVTVPGYQPYTFTGQADDAGNTMSGQVNGSGFTNAAAVLHRI